MNVSKKILSIACFLIVPQTKLCIEKLYLKFTNIKAQIVNGEF